MRCGILPGAVEVPRDLFLRLGIDSRGRKWIGARAIAGVHLGFAASFAGTCSNVAQRTKPEILTHVIP